MRKEISSCLSSVDPRLQFCDAKGRRIAHNEPGAGHWEKSSRQPKDVNTAALACVGETKGC